MQANEKSSVLIVCCATIVNRASAMFLGAQNSNGGRAHHWEHSSQPTFPIQMKALLLYTVNLTSPQTYPQHKPQQVLPERSNDMDDHRDAQHSALQEQGVHNQKRKPKNAID